MGFLGLQRSYVSRPAPSVRRAEAQTRRGGLPHHLRSPPPAGSISKAPGQALPSTEFLKGSRSLGLIRSTVLNIQRFLQAYVELGPNPDPLRVKQICEQHHIKLPDLPYIPIALLLTSLGGTTYYALAKRLLLVAVDLGLPMATYFLINAVLKRKDGSAPGLLSRPDLEPAVRDLQKRAMSGSDKRAMVIWGRVLLARGQEHQAMEMFKRAVQLDGILETEGGQLSAVNSMNQQISAEAQRQDSSTGNQVSTQSQEQKGDAAESPDIEERVIQESSMAQAYLLLGRHYLQQRDDEAAGSHFQIAAVVYGDADACLATAKLLQKHQTTSSSRSDPATSPSTQKPPSQTDDREEVERTREKYLLSAAREGNLEAAKLLAELYHSRSNREPSKPKQTKGRGAGIY